MADQKKFLDYEGVKYLWSKINMQDYPNNETLMDVIEAIDETKADKSELVQSDWNQNDETQIDYIKNRPFYESPVYYVGVELMNDGWSGRATCKLVSTPIEWTEEATYKIRVDGIDYEFNGMASKDGGNALGNATAYYIGAEWIAKNSNMDFSEYPFSLVTTDFENIYAVFEDDTIEHTVEFLVKEGVIHQIDSKFIKDMYYEEKVTKDISGEIYTINANDMPTHNQAIPLALGQVWTSRRCHYSGGWAEYLTFEVRQADDGTCYLGSPTLMDDEGYSVIYLTANELKTPSGMVSQGYRAFEFTCVSGKAVIDTKIHHIDPKYIKDMYYETEPLEIEIVSEITIEDTVNDYVVAEDFLEIMLQKDKTYVVTWNDEKYICKTNIDKAGEVYIGNQSIAINGAGATEGIFDKLIDSSEPFFIVSYEPDTWSLVVAESGSHTFSISMVEQNIHQIQSKYVGTDWNQSSPEGIGYINNRPFYDDMVYKLKTDYEIVDILNDAGYSIHSSSPKLIEDITFRVVVDGRVYDNVPVYLGCYMAGGYIFGIGDLYQSNPSGNNWKTTNYGFCYGHGIASNPDFFPNGIENIEIYSVERELKQIDPKYLPILEENFEIVFEANDITEPECFVENSKYKKLLGKYKITIDGTSEILEFIDTPDDFSWIECDSGYIETWNGGIYCNFYSDNESHSVKIESINHIINPKYIKDMYYEEPEIYTTLNVIDNGEERFYLDYLLELDKPYTVRIDGVVYSFDCLKKGEYHSPSGFYPWYLGAKYHPIYTINWDYPFTIFSMGHSDPKEETYILFEDGSPNHTVEFLEFEGKIHYIDPKYIKDMYYDTEKLTILREQDSFDCSTPITIRDDYHELEGFIGLKFDPDIIYYKYAQYGYWITPWNELIGKTVRVVFDGTPYDIFIDDGYRIGNLIDYPFFIYNDTMTDRVRFYVEEPGVHTFELILVEGEIKQIDPKYIPTATNDEIISMLAELDMLPTVTDSDGVILADENNNILL